MFIIEFSKRAKKFLLKCSKNLQKRIIDKIALLQEEPVPHKSVKVVGEEKTFRVRVGSYRILYQIKWSKKTIIIAKIDKRDKVYSR